MTYPDRKGMELELPQLVLTLLGEKILTYTIMSAFEFLNDELCEGSRASTNADEIFPIGLHKLALLSGRAAR